jgi:AcrR family transcriptional regulator
VPQQSIGRPRTYRSDLRQRQAAETRTRILEAAGELFADVGYARTTLAKIAAAAGVSPETVQAHGPKAALMIASLEYVSFGVEGDQSILDLDYGRTFVGFDDVDDAISYLVDVQTEVHGRSARLYRALRNAAAADAELERYLADLVAGVGRQHRRIMEVARDRGWLRDDVPFKELTEWAAVIASIESYDRMVLRDGFSVAAYKRYFRQALDAMVLRR